MFIRSYRKSPLNMQTKKFIGLQQCTLNIPNTNTKVFISISSDSKYMYFDIYVFYPKYGLYRKNDSIEIFIIDLIKKRIQ